MSATESRTRGQSRAIQQDVENSGLATERHGFTRASFLKAGGALIVGMAALPAAAQAAGVKGAGKGKGDILRPIITPSTTTTVFPAVEAGNLANWLAIQADGKITAYTGKVELGAGNQTALSQIVAEELDVVFDSVEMIMGDTALCVNQGPTYGSDCISGAGPQLRQVAADARQTLVELASQSLGVPSEQLMVREGVVSVKTNPAKKVSYAELVGGKVLSKTIPATKVPAYFTIGGTAKPKSPDEYSIVGVSVDRVDIPLKVKAEYTYVHDVILEGMLHGRVVRPPALEATLLSYGSVPDGVQVVHINDFLAVAAEEEYAAIQAAESIETKWNTRAILPKMDELNDTLFAAPSTAKIVESEGNVEAALQSASSTVLEASYSTAINTHGPLGPSCAVADVQSDYATIYSGTQGPNMVQESVAEVLKFTLDQVHVVAYPASGCYGRNGADPATADAAIMSKALGVPVRVQYSREDEHGWDPKCPPTVHQLRGGLDAEGTIVAWDHQAWLPNTGNVTLIGSYLAGNPVTEPEGGGSWAGGINYNFQNARLLTHGLGDLASNPAEGRPGMISAWMRSPPQVQIDFAEEAFIDELAAAAKADPIEFRLKMLKEERMIACLNLAAEMAEWETRPSPSPQAASSDRMVKGRGVAISLRGGTYNAGIAEVEVDRKTGKVTVKKFYVTQDNGLTINPRAVRAINEAAIVQTVSRAMLEEVTFSKEMITSLDWVSYPIIRFEEAPEVEFELINHPEIAATGAGEPACNPVGGAISNAIFDATGARVRSLPMRPKRVKEALDELAKKG